MFESAELGHAIDKARWRREEPRLRADLLDVQFEIGQLARFPVIVLVNGVDGAGKGETVNLLNSWMDPRHVRVHAFADPSEQDRSRPFMWRYWQALPPKGKVGVLFGSWYTYPIHERVMGRLKKGELDQALDEIDALEQMLASEGALVVKFWFHLSKRAQKKRLRKLEKDPATRWRVTPEDWKNHARYDAYREVSEHVLQRTSSGHAPWYVVAGEDDRYRGLTVGRILLEAMRRRVAQERKGVRAPIAAAAPPAPPPADGKDVVGALDLSLRLPEAAYERELEKQQGRLALLCRRKGFRRRSLVVAFEGSDAAGKGGAIRRVTGALDARTYRVVPIAAPTEEERAQPYLWRFWRHVPPQGRVAIFDRTWYGRVLVERVEGFAKEADWMRAYAELNAFEEQLSRAGAVVVKFWLQISPEEQLKRFRAREKTRFKRFKITPEDWRNRKKWPDYERAVRDMVDRTSTAVAPWTLVEANDKRWARVKVLRTIADRLEAALDG
ncbi:MAG: polyphosphate:AMP phosphotransferase [Anaeromyxobacter sp.]